MLAFAFEADAAVVDTNIARVLRARRRPAADAAARCRLLADAALPPGESWAWNQCLMDLGAVLCRPSNPACDDVPAVEHVCAWRGVGDDPGDRLGRRQRAHRRASTAATARPAAG